MDRVARRIVDELKKRISGKYALNEMKIFGSTVRGERREDSDIDVFVLLPKVNRKIEEDLFDIAYDLELEYDCLIDLIVFDEKALDGKFGTTPIYQKVLSEGMPV
jgi:predicted nucleotidyltransferase